MIIFQTIALIFPMFIGQTKMDLLFPSCTRINKVIFLKLYKVQTKKQLFTETYQNELI